MTEEMIVSNLVQNCIDSFKKSVLEDVRAFYTDYDPRKSLDKTYILGLISTLFEGLKKLDEELL